MMKLGKLIAAAGGTAITVVMLLIAYVPGFHPEGYERLRHDGLLYVVPLLSAIQISTTVAWLYISSQNKRGER